MKASEVKSNSISLSLAFDTILKVNDSFLNKEIATQKLKKIMKDIKDYLSKIPSWEDFMERERDQLEAITYD